MSSIPSSQWSERKHELYDTLNPEEQDLFDELQDEIEELRKLLGSKDKKQAAKKVFEISEKNPFVDVYQFNRKRCHQRISSLTISSMCARNFPYRRQQQVRP